MVDSMAEGLAHQLRLCGVDAATIPAGPKDQRHRAYRRLPSSCTFFNLPQQVSRLTIAKSTVQPDSATPTHDSLVAGDAIPAFQCASLPGL